MTPRLTNEQADAIAQFAQDWTELDVRAYENYSGRGMYGEECGGLVVGSLTDLFALGFAMGSNLPLLEDEYGLSIDPFDLPTQYDSLGFDIIVY